MKCPECDSQQPDDAETCSKCGLNFEAWREMNPIEASVQGEDMSFPEMPEDPKPEEEQEKAEATPPATRFREVAPDEKPPKAPREKKPSPVALLGGILGGLVVIGGLVFFLKKSGNPTPTAPVGVVAIPPVPTPSPSPTSTPIPTVVKVAPVVKPPTSTPTHTSTPRPQPTATFTPTDIPLDDKDEESPAEKEKVPAADAKDLLESSEPAATETLVPTVAVPSAPSSAPTP